MKSRDVICTECFHTTAQTTHGVAFPGLPRYDCPRCRRSFNHPAGIGRRLLGLLLLGGLAWGAHRGLGERALPVTGAFVALFVLALLRDVRAAGRVRAAEERVSSRSASAARADLLATQMQLGQSPAAADERPRRRRVTSA